MASYVGGMYLQCVSLVRLQLPVTQSNANLGIAMKIFVGLIEVHSQSSLSKEDYPV